MNKQTIEFAVTRGNNNSVKVSKTSIPQPKTSFEGGSVKWLEDKHKDK